LSFLGVNFGAIYRRYFRRAVPAVAPTQLEGIIFEMDFPDLKAGVEMDFPDRRRTSEA